MTGRFILAARGASLFQISVKPRPKFVGVTKLKAGFNHLCSPDSLLKAKDIEVQSVRSSSASSTDI